MNKQQTEENTESNTLKCVAIAFGSVTTFAIVYLIVSHGYSVSITKGDFALSLNPSALSVAA